MREREKKNKRTKKIREKWKIATYLSIIEYVRTY